MAGTTADSNNDYVARIASVQQGLKRELGEMEAKAKNIDDREQDADAALNEAITEEQEAREKFNEAKRRYEGAKHRREQSERKLDVVQEERKVLVTQYVQKGRPC